MTEDRDLIGGMSLDDERKAELTLLIVLEDMLQSKRLPYLMELGISFEEFNRIYEKWYRVLTRYRKEKESSNDNL